MGESNWAGNLAYTADSVLTPHAVDEVREAVAAATHVKALGSRHCFNAIADSPGGALLDLRALEVPVEIGDGTVTVGGSARYGDFAELLHAAGFALPNLASLPHITVAGSVATGTHGSGRRQPGLASAVSAIELVTANGELRTFTRAHAEFPGLGVGLGATGVVTRLTLDVVPAFDVRQDGFDGLPWEAAYRHFDEIEDAGYSVSMFTNWANDTIDQVWVKSRVDAFTPRTGLFAAVPAAGPRHPAHDRLPHFARAFTPSGGDELQSEYFVPYEDAVAAARAIREIGDLLAPLLLVSEIRAIAGDALWLSPCHGGDRVAFHFTWQPRQREVEAVLPVLEERLAAFGARPHWGKLFHTAGSYPRMAGFRALTAELDPAGKFRNPFLE